MGVVRGEEAVSWSLRSCPFAFLVCGPSCLLCPLSTTTMQLHLGPSISVTPLLSFPPLRRVGFLPPSLLHEVRRNPRSDLVGTRRTHNTSPSRLFEVTTSQPPEHRNTLVVATSAVRTPRRSPRSFQPTPDSRHEHFSFGFSLGLRASKRYFFTPLIYPVDIERVKKAAKKSAGPDVVLLPRPQ